MSSVHACAAPLPSADHCCCRWARTEVPGPPTWAVVSASTTQPGTINVAWRGPIVPHHGLWCAGNESHPQPCPLSVPGNPDLGSGATGGQRLQKYVVEWDVQPGFNSGFAPGSAHKGEAEVPAWGASDVQSTHTILGLAVGRVYYVRVYAYTSVGRGVPCERQPDAVTGLCTGPRLQAVPV